MRTAGLAAVLAVLIAPLAAAQTAVPAWENAFRASPTFGGNQTPLAARELADGSVMLVHADGAGLSAVRHAPDGSTLSTASFYPAFTLYDLSFVRVAVDAFGGVVVAGATNLCCSPLYDEGESWVMKYDGVSGAALWASPAVYDTGLFVADVPTDLFVDGSGDVTLTGLSAYTVFAGNPATLFTFRYDGATGAVLWGPVLESGVMAHAAALDASGSLLLSMEEASQFSYLRRAVRYSPQKGATLWTTDLAEDGSSPTVAAIDTDGGLLVAALRNFGPTKEFQVDKFAGDTGAHVWGPVRWSPEGGSSDMAPSAIVSGPGGIVVAGYTSGQVVALRVASSSGALLGDPILDGACSICAVEGLVAGNGDVVLLWPSTTYDVIASRHDSAGRPLWGPATVLDADYDPVPAVALLTSSGRLLVSSEKSNGADQDSTVVELDGMTGEPAWGPIAFTGAASPRSSFNDLAVDPNGDLLVTGNVLRGNGKRTWATLKYDRTTGATLWGPVFYDTNSSSDLTPYQVLVDAAGDVLVTGYVGDPTFSLMVQKYRGSDGALLWTSPPGGGDRPYHMALDSAGNAIVVSRVFNSSNYDATIVKFSGANGSILWGPVTLDIADDYVWSLALDQSGNAFVCGVSADTSYPYAYHWFTAKFSGATGAKLWGPVLLDDGVASSLSVDPAGDVVVSGYQGNTGAVVKYSGQSGAVAWGPVAIPATSYGDVIGLAIDANGDVFTVGDDYTTLDDFATTKLRGTDGGILWGPVLFDGPVGGWDYVYGVVLDAAGNPIVAGTTRVSAGNDDATILKYDAATGTKLWGPLYGGGTSIENVNGVATALGTIFVGAARADSYFNIAYSESLGIATLPELVAPAYCGVPYSSAFDASNGTPPYSWTVDSGSLPPGITLAADGTMSGTPAEEGSFAFRARVQDSLGAFVSRDFTFAVAAPHAIPVLASTDDACQTTLSLGEAYASYQWLPGGETTPSITVRPAETTTYGVLVGDGSGCLLGGAITVPGTALTNPGCLAPTIASLTPDSGPATGGAPVAIAGDRFQPGAVVAFGAEAAVSAVVVDPTRIDAVAPALPPGTAADVVVTNPDSGRARLPRAWVADFTDVPPDDPFHSSVLTVLRAGITSGCGNGNYCPTANVTRAQMAVFLVKARFGASYVPPPASGAVFSDVPANAFAADYIEQLVALGVTAGCGGGLYCPGAVVTRAQMAVFLLKASLGESYIPPPATGAVFDDVPVDAFAAAWIEDLRARNITSGCSVTPPLFCPNAPNTRAQMAVFLVRAFGL